MTSLALAQGPAQLPEIARRTMRTGIGAEARGQLRVYKKQLAANFEPVNKLYLATAKTTIADFTYKSEKGRTRVFTRLNTQLTRYGAQLSAKRLSGKQPLAIWAILKPRDAVRVEPDHPRDGQPCVCVDYLALGWTPEGAMAAQGLWTLEITDHALGRCFERCPGIDPNRLILTAHHAVLNIRQPDIADCHDGFLLRAGRHVWACEFRLGRYDATLADMLTAHVLIRTYLPFDQIDERKEAALIVPKPSGSDRLGQSWLLPVPWRTITNEPTKGRMRIDVADPAPQLMEVA